jgi:hypothetical protein
VVVVVGGKNQPDALPGQRLAAPEPPIYEAFDAARWLIPSAADKPEVSGVGQGKPPGFCGLPKKLASPSSFFPLYIADGDTFARLLKSMKKIPL